MENGEEEFVGMVLLTMVHRSSRSKVESRDECLLKSSTDCACKRISILLSVKFSLE